MRNQAARIAFAGIVIAALPSAVAQAQTPVNKRTVKAVTGQLGGSINNAGVQHSYDFSVSRRLNASKNPWLADAHVALGGGVALTPAGVRLGAWVEWAPVSVYVVRAGAEPASYFGTFHSLTSFDSRLDAFDPDARKARDDAHPGMTKKDYLAQTLQFRAGHVVARSTLNTEWWSSNTRGPLFYEPTRDTLLAVDGDHLVSLTSALLFQKSLNGGGQFMVGPMHSIMRVHGEHSLNRVQKIGAVAVHQMSGTHLGVMRPSLSAQVAYYLDDPSKKGQWGAAMAIGFSLGKRQ